jgi:hypothetical protein
MFAALVLTALLSNPTAPPPLAPETRAALAVLTDQIEPAYLKEFAKLCPGAAITLSVDTASFAADPAALKAFTGSAISEPWNRAVGPLGTILRDRCADAPKRAAISAKLKRVHVVQRADQPPSASSAAGVLTLTVDAEARTPPPYAEVSAALDALLN